MGKRFLSLPKERCLPGLSWPGPSHSYWDAFKLETGVGHAGRGESVCKGKKGPPIPVHKNVFIFAFLASRRVCVLGCVFTTLPWSGLRSPPGGLLAPGSAGEQGLPFFPLEIWGGTGPLLLMALLSNPGSLLRERQSLPRRGSSACHSPFMSPQCFAGP